MKYAVITGSAGLIGADSVRFFSSKGFNVIGIDNNMRMQFFGDEASTDWQRKLIKCTIDLGHQQDVPCISSVSCLVFARSHPPQAPRRNTQR